MDTKLKTKYIYIISFIIGFYMLSLGLLSAQDYIENNDKLTGGSYFSSEEFENTLTEYSGKILTFYSDFKDYSQKSDEDKVTREKLEELKRKYNLELDNQKNEIDYEYSQLIANAEASKDKDKIISLISEKYKKLDEVKKEIMKTDEELKKEVIKNSDIGYENMKTYIEKRGDIRYYINNKNTKEVYTNLQNISNDIEDYIKNEALYVKEFPLQYKESDKLYYFNKWFKDNNYEGYLVIPKNIQGNSDLVENCKQVIYERELIIDKGIVAGISLILTLVIFIFLKKYEEPEINNIDKLKNLYIKIPLDLRVVIFIIYSLIIYIYQLNSGFLHGQFIIDQAIKITLITLYLIYLFYTIKGCRVFIQDRNKLSGEWEGSIFYKVSGLLNSTKKRVLVIGIFTTFLGLIIFFQSIFEPYLYNSTSVLLTWYTIYQLIVLSIVLFWVLKKSKYIDKILKGTKEILLGNLDYVIEEEGKGNVTELAHNINNMRTGYKNSLESEIKSERLKTELITNVSHDLKTPLTSIINYINLLKKENISNDELSTYIEILDRKSERLKILINDLFEAAKMSSGSVELNIEKINVAQLLKQAIAEFEEKFTESSLELKFNCDKKHVYANLDGKKSWRAFENLISNIIKYSQPNTRVYIDLVEEKNKVKIIMKNISAYELNFNADEIFERFKRGDKSRNKEGSGLGLTIAKSIVELQGGKINIEIDGDLFKAVVEFDSV